MAAAVPFLAGGGAGVAADADVEIDDEAELFWPGSGAGSEVTARPIATAAAITTGTVAQNLRQPRKRRRMGH